MNKPRDYWYLEVPKEPYVYPRFLKSILDYEFGDVEVELYHGSKRVTDFEFRDLEFELTRSGDDLLIEQGDYSSTSNWVKIPLEDYDQYDHLFPGFHIKFTASGSDAFWQSLGYTKTSEHCYYKELITRECHTSLSNWRSDYIWFDWKIPVYLTVVRPLYQLNDADLIVQSYLYSPDTENLKKAFVSKLTTIMPYLYYSNGVQTYRYTEYEKGIEKSLKQALSVGKEWTATGSRISGDLLSVQTPLTTIISVFSRKRVLPDIMIYDSDPEYSEDEEAVDYGPLRVKRKYLKFEQRKMPLK